MVDDHNDQVNNDTAPVYDDLHIGEEQVTSNECWDLDDDAEPSALESAREPEPPVYADLDIGYEQVTSNECYDVEYE